MIVFSRFSFSSLLSSGLLAVLVLFGGIVHADDQGSNDAPQKEIKIAAGAFTRGDPLPKWAQPLASVPETQRHDPLVVRLAETQFHVGREHSLLVNRAEQVNDAASLGDIGEYPLYFIPQYQKLHLHKLAILRGKQVLDRTRKVNVRFLQREAGLEEGMYSGMATAMLLVDDVRVGDTLLVTYSIDGQNPVFANTYAETANWDQEEPVALRRVWLIHPSNRPIHWRQLGDFNARAVEPVISESGGEQRLKFEEHDLEGVDNEADVPSDYLPYRSLEFSEYEDWNSVARWASSLFPRVDTLSPELQALVDRIKHLPNDEARASAALQWVQDEVRYFSVSLGESSHRPYPPAVVAKRRFGDCKDKTYLLVTLLHAMGIDAHPMLLAADAPLLPKRMIPTPTVFDHVVVAAHIGEKTYYLDGTRLEQHGQLDRIGATLPGAFGLLVDSTTTALTELENPALPELVRHELTETITLADLNGDGHLDAAQTWHGGNAEIMRQTFGRMTPEQQRKQALSQYARHYPSIELVDPPAVQDDPQQNDYTITLHFKVPKLLTTFRDGWTLHYFPANLSGLISIPDKVARNFPLAESDAPRLAHYHLTVNWPAQISATEDPQSRRVDSPYFNLTTQRSFRGNVTTLDVDFSATTKQIAANEVPHLVEDVKKIDGVLTGVIAADRTALKPADGAGKVAASLPDTLRARMQTQIERVGTVLDSGQLTGEDRAEALCARADAELGLERLPEATQDADAALQAGPVLGRAWECHGDMLAAHGEFTRAVADYGKALSLGVPMGDLYYRRGRAYFYGGDFTRAAADFAKVREAGRQTADADSVVNPLYAALWESWSLQRLQQPLPAALVSLAQTTHNGTWPQPALAMFAGSAQPEQVLASVRRRQGDDQELTSVEAWFYIGQYQLLHGNRAEARKAFEKVRASGITMYDEYAAAAFELKALDAGQNGATRP